MKKCKKTNEHHRLPTSRGGTDTFPHNNMVTVSVTRHAHWHALFSNRDLESIVKELNNVWIDSRYKLKIEQR